MLTEADAKTKWCPFARLSLFPKAARPSPSHNRAADMSEQGELRHNVNPQGTRCIASECMAWRWKRDYIDTPEEKREGCCGLAGRS